MQHFSFPHMTPVVWVIHHPKYMTCHLSPTGRTLYSLNRLQDRQPTDRELPSGRATVSGGTRFMTILCKWYETGPA